jgi:hypothetical protein
VSHRAGCPCNGWGGAYAHCTCDAINLRENTEALERHTQALRDAGNKDADIDLLRDQLSASESRVADLELLVRALWSGAARRHGSDRIDIGGTLYFFDYPTRFTNELREALRKAVSP